MSREKKSILSFKVFKHSKYFSDPKNWIEIPLFSLSFIYSILVIASVRKSYCLSAIEWQIGVIIICLAWIEFIFASRQFHIIGVYAITFWRVMWILIKFIPFAGLLIVAFGLSFYLLLYQSTYKVLHTYSVCVHYIFFPITGISIPHTPILIVVDLCYVIRWEYK